MVEEKARFIMRTNPTNSWTTYNPILRRGEIGIEETQDGLYLIKIGDGATSWNNLPYAEPYTDETLSLHNYAADAWAVGARIRDLESRISIVEKPVVEISGLSITPNSFEIGSTVTSVTLYWNYKNGLSVVSQSINGTSIPLENRSYTFTGQTISQTTEFVLTAVDIDGNEISNSVYIVSSPNIYYGAALIPVTYNSAFVLSLSNQSYNGDDISVNINAATNNYSYICYPARFGNKGFYFNNIRGGFSLQDTISFTNSYGYTESYYIYRSDYPSLGAIKINIRGDV